MDAHMRRACEWICSQMRARTTREDVLRLKREAAVRFMLKRLPKNSEILEVAGNDQFMVELLQKRPTRTLSGVAVVAIMTSPHPCPHGVCVPCPGGPHTPYASPQSYVGREPAARRAAQWGFDPYMQTSARLHQLSSIGHGVSKVELIVMGGTFTARPATYQRWFVMRALQAMNEYPHNAQGKLFSEGAASPEELAHAQRVNERASVRCVGLTLETRPDWAREEHIDVALELGATKVELGVQNVFDDVLAAIDRGHTVQDAARANQILRDSGLKVGFHIMPGLPSTSLKRDVEMFRLLFSDERFMPDYLKIYPTLVIKGTRLYEMMEQGEYTPLDTKRAVELLASVKPMLPKWVRVSRIQRDIPCQFVEAGVQKSNLRELVHDEMRRRGTRCRCIRCREVGRRWGTEPRLMWESYRACGGTEHFISMEDPERDVLFGFIRLRYPNEPHRTELSECALIRELHVYGRMADIGERPSDTKWQHRGLGELLLRAAEQKAAEDGFSSVAVLSGIGAREYYLQRGYERKGPYMIKQTVSKG